MRKKFLQRFAVVSETKKFSKLIGLADVILMGFIATSTINLSPARADVPCSCWDSGTSVYMGAKCHAAWDNVDSVLQHCIDDPAKSEICMMFMMLWGPIIAGASAMEACHQLCNAAQKSGASGYTGYEWWYADPTAHASCLSQNPNVLRNWKG